MTDLMGYTLALSKAAWMVAGHNPLYSFVLRRRANP